eukprot:c18295_g1_i1 orf=529-2097(+)
MSNIVLKEAEGVLQTNGEPPTGLPNCRERDHTDIVYDVDANSIKLGYRRLVKPVLKDLSFFSLVIFIGAALFDPLWRNSIQAIITQYMYAFVGFSAVCVGVLMYMVSARSSIYLIDFGCYRPPNIWRFPAAAFMEHLQLCGLFDDKSLDFQRKILERSGLGEQTAMSYGFHYLPPKISLDSEREESERTLFAAVEELLSKTKIEPLEIDVLIVNCSCFSPVPSISAMIVNKYKLRSDIKSYSLAGMGCSAGAISVDMAKNILLANPNTTALIISTENMSRNCYFGNNRSMLLTNCIFRVGGAVALLSNKSTLKKHAKYQLITTVRTHTGADDKSYNCVYQEEDENGLTGVNISKNLMSCAGNALKVNITRLGPIVLPISEQLRFLAHLIAKKFSGAEVKKQPYIPDFTKAFDHFCIHTGGRAVVQELENRLRLRPEHTEPTRMTLHRFGNTSSSSMWYTMGYVEAKGRVKRGHKLWQIGLGSGFKCCSVVWRALKNVDRSEKGAWSDCIVGYPIHVPDVVPI